MSFPHILTSVSHVCQSCWGKWSLSHVCSQVSSQLVRGTFGDGEPHSIPVPVNLAELLGLGSQGPVKLLCLGLRKREQEVREAGL